MRFFYLIPILLTLSACTNQKGDSNTDQGRTESKIKYTKVDLIGDWKLVNTNYLIEKQSISIFEEAENDYWSMDQVPPVFIDSEGVLRPDDPDDYLGTDNFHLRITKDSINGLKYPFQLYNGGLYVVEKDRLKTNDTGEGSQIWMSTNKDSLQLSSLDAFGLFTVRTFVKTSLDEKIMNILNTYTINYPELAGDWKVVRNEEGPAGEDYRLEEHFHYKISDKITFSKKELETAMYSDMGIYMTTDGIKRKYFLSYKYDEIRLSPDTWFSLEERHKRHLPGPFYLRYKKLE